MAKKLNVEGETPVVETPVVETPVVADPIPTPELSPREKAWNRLIEKYRTQSPKMYDLRVSRGEDFTKIPDSFQGIWTIENGKEIIY